LRAEPGRREAVIAAGLDGFPGKPFSSADLYTVLEARAAATVAAEAA